ncbi:hypothetical protein GW17_00061851, partial [Ensete ventricosum]
PGPRFPRPRTPLGLRGLCSRSGRPQLIKVELHEEDFPPEIEVLGMRRLEDVIHAIVVRRSAPYWLPFLPGSSYWVPPPNCHRGVAEIVSRLANPMTEEEIMSFTTVRGWPSSAYFVEGNESLKNRCKRSMRNFSVVYSNSITSTMDYFQSQFRGCLESITSF